jgi:predicted phosphodiesterase
MKDLLNLRPVVLMVLLVSVSMVSGCASSVTPTDTGRDIIADTAVADTAVADTAVADTAVADTAIADTAITDTTHEFQWASGCEGTGTGATWTLIEDHTFLRGPMIQMSDWNTATILWRTAVKSDEEGCVDYEVGAETFTKCGTSDKRGQYEITLDDLPAATEITYSARVGDIKTTDLTFRTMPDRPAPMKFAVFADAHCNIENLKKMTAVALAEGVDFAFGIGDFINTPEDVQFDQVFEGLQDLGSRVNIWAVLGNHDTGGMYFYNAFALPKGNTIEPDYSNGYGEAWWDKRIGNVWLGGGWVIPFLFGEPEGVESEQSWFRQRFQEDHFKTAQWKLFFIHEPPYCQGWGGCNYDGEECLRESLMPMAAENGIQATFHGHMHGIEYGETNGVKVFIPGGVGGDLDYFCENSSPPQPWAYNYVHNVAIVETNCDKMVVRFLGLDGVELDRVEVPWVEPTQ